MIDKILEHHHQMGVYRSIGVEPAGLDFSSNDYLGLSQSVAIRAKLVQALSEGIPLGATGSRLISGTQNVHEQVESFLARTFLFPSALLFSSGFAANMGVMSALGTTDTEFFSDELNHASLIDGMRLSKGRITVFSHNNLNDLESKLKCSSSSMRVIVTESVFSMDGDLAPLSEINNIAQRYDAFVVVDEAHATGIFGKDTLGCLSDLSVNTDKFISVHTGGKALGGQGAFVLCSQKVRELIINRARSFIYSTALSPLLALQIKFAVEEILKNPERGRQLLDRSLAFITVLNEMGFGCISSSQIVPIVLGSNEKAIAAAQGLAELGINTKAIRSPTVPRGTERLRLVLKSFHTLQNLEYTIKCLKQVVH